MQKYLRLLFHLKLFGDFSVEMKKTESNKILDSEMRLSALIWSAVTSWRMMLMMSALKMMTCLMKTCLKTCWMLGIQCCWSWLILEIP